ncbi:MAG: AzlD domain-containing protein [Betaproteobacteria bacterium]|nr:MAG: AzlD domain-containing protein [Betaproteobacteria bacterium]
MARVAACGRRGDPHRRRRAGLVAAGIRRAARLHRHDGAAVARPGDDRRGRRRRGQRGGRACAALQAVDPARRAGRHRRWPRVRKELALSIWVTLAGMALVTYALRASFLLLPPHVETPPLLRRALRYVPAAVLTAIWAPELLVAGGELAISSGNERLLAGAVAIAVAWRWRLTFATILAGLAALHFFHWIL